MRFFVGITDRNWFDFLSRMDGLDEVDFWQPSGQQQFRALQIGEPFLFKLHSPDDYIVGGGFFSHFTILPASIVWQAFGEKNTARTDEEMRARIARYRRTPVAVFALADGKIERRSLGPVSVGYAKEQRAIYQRKVREGTYTVKQPQVKQNTIADFWKSYLEAYKLRGKKSAWRQEGAWNNHLKEVFGNMRADSLTTADLVSYQTHRAESGASNGTVNRELSALMAALNHANEMTVEGGKPLLAYVPKLTKLKEPPPRKGFIKARQYAKLCEHAKPLWLRAFIACCYTFGFRRGEMLNLRVRQCDFLDRWIELEEGTTKNDEGRKAQMTAEVFTLLKSCCVGRNPDDHVFTREDGSPVRDPRDDWYKLCIEAGFGAYVKAKRQNGKAYDKYVGLQPHDFRRTTVRNLIRSVVISALSRQRSRVRVSSSPPFFSITCEAIPRG